jgi:hypothetical protein
MYKTRLILDSPYPLSQDNERAIVNRLTNSWSREQTLVDVKTARTFDLHRYPELNQCRQSGALKHQ